MIKTKHFTFILFFVAISIISSLSAKAEQFYGIGAELFQDPFNKKVIITKILPNSPSERAGIKEGSEIVSVDDFKVRKNNLCETVTKIRGEENSEIKLVIRNGWKWKTITLTREQINTEEPKIDEELETYWNQIVPICYRCIKYIDKKITDKFSLKYKKTVLPAVHYWLERKARFEIGYNTCKKYSENNKEKCFINLLNRENQTTGTDKQIYKVLQNKPE